MIRKILTFNGLDNVSFTTEEYVPPEGGCVLFTDFSTVSPGTELFSIREGRPVQPGYIRTGHTADGQHCFVFPSMAESSADTAICTPPVPARCCCRCRTGCRRNSPVSCGSSTSGCTPSAAGNLCRNASR